MTHLALPLSAGLLQLARTHAAATGYTILARDTFARIITVSLSLSLSLSHHAAALITSSGALNQLHNSHFTVYHIGATVSLLIVCYYRTNANNVILLYAYLYLQSVIVSIL